TSPRAWARAMIPVTISMTLVTTSSCQMRARSGKFLDSPITILAIAGTRPRAIIRPARDRISPSRQVAPPARAVRDLWQPEDRAPPRSIQAAGFSAAVRGHAEEHAARVRDHAAGIPPVTGAVEAVKHGQGPRWGQIEHRAVPVGPALGSRADEI